MASKAGVVHRVEGAKATRRSPRNYTHAVVGEYDQASAKAHAIKSTTERAEDSWDYAADVAKQTVGVIAKDRRFATTAEEVAKARAQIATPRAEYIAAQVAERLKSFAADTDGELLVLQWSMSERAARNAVGSLANRSFTRNVRVVPVVRAA